MCLGTGAKIRPARNLPLTFFAKSKKDKKMASARSAGKILVVGRILDSNDRFVLFQQACLIHPGPPSVEYRSRSAKSTDWSSVTLCAAENDAAALPIVHSTSKRQVIPTKMPGNRER